MGEAQPADVFDLASTGLEQVNKNDLLFRESVSSSCLLTSHWPRLIPFILRPKNIELWAHRDLSRNLSALTSTCMCPGPFPHALSLSIVPWGNRE